MVPVPELLPKVNTLEELESSLSKVIPTVLTNSMQSSIELVLSFLGCNQALIPVVLPVTAKLDTFAAVIRSGALPFMLDVDADGQLNEDLLDSVFEEFDKQCIIVLTRPLGYSVRPSLSLACAGVPTIVVNDFLPPAELSTTTLLGDFNIFDLSLMMGGEGSAIYTPYMDSRMGLRTIQQSLEGPSCLPSPLSCTLGLARVAYLKDRETQVRAVAEFYAKELGVLLEDSQAFPFFPIHKQENKLKLPWALGPLHRVAMVQKRFPKGTKNTYPGADAVEKHFLALPCSPDLIQQKDALKALCDSLQEC